MIFIRKHDTTTVYGQLLLTTDKGFLICTDRGDVLTVDFGSIEYAMEIIGSSGTTLIANGKPIK